jgi:hypothetical protein
MIHQMKMTKNIIAQMIKSSLFMYNVIFVAALFFGVGMAFAGAHEEGNTVSVQNYRWTSGPLAGELWDIAQGDWDGDGVLEIAFLERKRVRIGHLSEKGFEERQRCSWKSDAEAARASFLDLDGDGKEELIISAVESGLPASLALTTDGTSCREVFSRARWSLRAIEVLASPEQGGGRKKKLFGQGWSSQSFFSGPVREMAFKDGHLSDGAPVDLPRLVTLFQFTFLPAQGNGSQVAVLKGSAPMEVREKQGKKWKRIWHSGGHLGGTTNVLPAPQRPALDQIAEEDVAFDLPPIVVETGDRAALMAIRGDEPLKGVIGRRPYVRGGELVAFAPDPALGFVELARTQWIPGPIVGAIVVHTEGGVRQALLLRQEDVGAFESARKSSVLAFDVP